MVEKHIRLKKKKVSLLSSLVKLGETLFLLRINASNSESNLVFLTGPSLEQTVLICYP